MIDLNELSGSSSPKEQESQQMELVADYSAKYMDDSGEMQYLAQLRATGRTELMGSLLFNEPRQIIGTCKDSFDELLYLVAFEPTEHKSYLP